MGNARRRWRPACGCLVRAISGLGCSRGEHLPDRRGGDARRGEGARARKTTQMGVFVTMGAIRARARGGRECARAQGWAQLGLSVVSAGALMSAAGRDDCTNHPPPTHPARTQAHTVAAAPAAPVPAPAAAAAGAPVNMEGAAQAAAEAAAEAVAEPQAGSQAGSYYNPRPRARSPDPRIEVEETQGVSGPRSVVRISFGTEGASSLSSVFTMCNSAIGAGVLSLPYAFHCAGLAGCLLLSVVVASMEAFTLYVLAKFAERYDSASSYGTLVRRALGKKTAAALSGVLLLYLYGSCMAYLVIIADTFTSLSGQYLGPEAWTSRRPVVLLVSGGLINAMCLAPNLQALERVSVAAVAGFVYTALAVVVRGTQAVTTRPDPWEGVSLFKLDFQALYALSIVVFGFNAHANVVPIFHELEHFPSRLVTALPASPSGYHTRGVGVYTYKLLGMMGAIICACSLIFTGYMAVGTAGYLTYPLNVSSNILNSFPADDVVMQVARGVIGCVVLGHWPLNHHPARQAFEDLLGAFGVTPRRWVLPTFTVLFVWLNVSASLLVTDLGAVLHTVGGTAAAFMIFFLPGLLLMNAAIIKHTSSALNLSQMADDAESTVEPTPGSVADGDDASVSVPLLVDKKAGIRDAGLIFAPGKSWWIGLLLVVVSGVVLAITVVTAVAGA